MKYYSTNKQAPLASLEEAVVKGLAGDKGLYMPEHIRPLDKDTISGLKNKSFHEIACTAAQAFFGEDIIICILLSHLPQENTLTTSANQISIRSTPSPALL